MADFLFTVTYEDELNGTTSKAFAGSFADFATARTAAVAFLADLQAATTAHIAKWTLAEVNTVAGSPAVGSRVFERVSATVALDGKAQRANLQFPAPDGSIMSGNALASGSANWLALVANLATGAGWFISDGDTYALTVAGKRVFVNSGKTNLPV